MSDEEGKQQELVQRIWQHDSNALADFLEIHREKLLQALSRKVGAGLRKKLELEDIYQEVATRALKDLASVDFKGQDPIGWLYQVMDRQIIDLHRFHFEAQKRDAGREVSADTPQAHGSDGEPGVGKGFADLLVASMTTPSAAMSKNLKLVRVYKAIGNLSEDMQKAIRWRYLENLPSQKIAEKLGKSDAATRVLLSRAVRKLQSELSE